MEKQEKIVLTEAEFREHCNNYDGVCFACKEWTVGGVEPDAREYTCDECDRAKVYGAEEALLMGVIEINE
jgi:hypothetical protein